MAASLCFGLLSSGGLKLSLAGALLFGCGSGGVMLALWALTASAAAVRGQPTMSFAVVTCAAKLALAAAAFAVGGLLGHTSYRSHAGAFAFILPVMVAAPALGSLAATFVLSIPRRPAGPLRRGQASRQQAFLSPS